MYWEVFKYDTTLTQIVHIHFLFKCPHDDGLMLAAIELVKLIMSIAFIRLNAVILGQTTLNFEDLTHQINDTVIEIDDHDHGISVSGFLCLLKVFRLLNMVVY